MVILNSKTKRLTRKYTQLFFLIVNLILLTFVMVFFYSFNKNIQNLEKKFQLFQKICSTLELKYQNCIIYGSENVTKDLIYEYIPQDTSKTINQIQIHNILKKFYEQSWVSFCSVHRIFPNTLIIKIKEKTPIAVWTSESNHTFLIDAMGNRFQSIISSQKQVELIHIFGEGANLNAYQLITDINNNSFLKNKVYSAVYISGRRWDIILKNGTIIKMPERGFSDAWERAASILEDAYSLLEKRNIISMDLRNPEKIYFKQGKSNAS